MERIRHNFVGDKLALSAQDMGSQFPERDSRRPILEDVMTERLEQALSNQVMNYLAIRGILHYRVRNTGTIVHKRGGGLAYGRDRYAVTQRGAPDIFAWHGGHTYAFELKSPTGRVRQEQIEWLARFRESGGIAFVIRSFEEVQEIFEKKPKFQELAPFDKGA
jgi:penicillin-binding protein-related factor A (putative recombinase)